MKDPVTKPDWDVVRCFLLNFGDTLEGLCPELMTSARGDGWLDVEPNWLACMLEEACDRIPSEKMGWVPDCLHALGYHFASQRVGDRLFLDPVPSAKPSPCGEVFHPDPGPPPPVDEAPLPPEPVAMDFDERPWDMDPPSEPPSPMDDAPPVEVPPPPPVPTEAKTVFVVRGSAYVDVTKEQYTDTFRGKTTTKTVFVVRAPYNKTFNNYKVPGRWWDGKVKAWRVPVKYESQLCDALRAAYKGRTMCGPDGLVTKL